MTQRKTQAAVEVLEKAKSADQELLDTPLYGVAMLKIAMELKKPNARGLDEILSGVLNRMGLDEVAFRRYLNQNNGLLQAIAQRKKY